jgi:hypothetical protein
MGTSEYYGRKTESFCRTWISSFVALLIFTLMFAGRLIHNPKSTLAHDETIHSTTARSGPDSETHIVNPSSNPSIVGRRQDWESSGTPAWCSDLIKNQRPSNAVPGTPQEKITCARRTAEGDCYDGTPIRFFSQHHQDAYLYVHHFQYLKHPGVYMDKQHLLF